MDMGLVSGPGLRAFAFTIFSSHFSILLNSLLLFFHDELFLTFLSLQFYIHKFCLGMNRVGLLEFLHSIGASGSAFTLFLPRHGPARDATMMSNLLTVTEVSDIVQLVKAFQCLRTFNLNLRGAYDQIFDLLCLRRKLLAMEDTLKKL